MRINHFLTALILTLSASVFSQNTLLWEICGRKTKGKSYLYGTMHSMDERAYEFNDSLLIVFDNCKAYAMEFVPNKKNMDAVMKHMYLPEGTSLQDLYSAEDYQLLSDAVKQHLGMSIRLYDKMKPFFIMSMFMQKTMKADRPTFVDQFLYNLAIEKGMKTISVEKVKEQIKAIEDTPASVLTEYIKNMGSGEEEQQMEELIEAYRTQDLDKMSEISKRDTSNKEMMTSLLTVRNITMAKRIDKMIRKRSTFVAIGALHLPGEDGVIALLREKGYCVRPVYAPYNAEK
ncbi:MAG: TraB/GumN family protein [Bacteroidales bacterium]|nr:TraB/GumN family protein [Bacteroidales bacterium]